jgi:hypothetical protein
MKSLRIIIAIICTSLFVFSCADQGDEMGKSTPIDSTNVNGTAPATYGGDDPANDQDTNRTNANDTGSDPSNLSNTGNYEKKN